MLRTIFLCILAAASVRANSLYDVTINTSGLSTVTGDLVFDFISGGGPASNTVSILGFTSDGTLGAVSPTGLVSGTLPGTVTISDDAVLSVFNEYLTGFTFGTTISFSLNATENAPGASSSPDELSIYLLATDDMTSLITTSDPTFSDALLTLDLDGSTNGVATVYSVSDPSGVGANMTPGSEGSSVPEPSTTWTALAALALLGVWKSILRYRSLTRAAR
jgi:hypothetical protein